MIVTTPKAAESILSHLAGRTRVAVVGCGLCATSCNTGGKKEVAAMADFLASRDHEVTWTAVLDGACQRMLILRDISRLPKPDAVVVMACGSGTQMVGSTLEVKAVPALDTVYLGGALRAGSFEPKCSLCGDCRLADFANRCPVTACAKSLWNGPCGGMVEGKCETSPERDCVWYLIYRDLERDGDAASLMDVVPPRTHR